MAGSRQRHNRLHPRETFLSNHNSQFPRLVYICHEFPKFTETFVYREVKGLIDRGRSVLVFSMKKTGAPEQIEDLETFLSITRQLPPDFSWEFIKTQLKWIFRKPVGYIKELMRVVGTRKRKSALPVVIRTGLFLRGALIASMLEEEKNYRFMHVPGTGGELISAHAAFVLTGIPYGFALHAPYPLYLGSPLLVRHAQDAMWIAAISKDARELIVKLAGENVREKIRIVHCGVRAEDYTPVKIKERKEKKISSVGSLAELKGHDLLVKAMPELLRRGMDVSLDIVGEGPERNNLESLARKLNVSDRVNLHGRCHPKKVRDLLSDSDAFALMCRIDSRKDRDGIPVALMEAMAMGLPCISTGISGIPELIEDGFSGILIEPDDVEALAGALEKVLKDSRLAQTLGDAARKRVMEHFSLSGQVERLEKLIATKAR